MENFIFGTLSTLEKRVGRTLERQRGLRHDSRLEPIMPRPDEPPVASVLVKHEAGVRAITCHITEPAAVSVPFVPVETRWDLLDWQYYQVWQAQLPAQPDGTLVRYRITAETNDGAPLAPEAGIYAYLVGMPEPPAWSQSAVIYQVMPDRFAGGEGSQLGDIDDPNAIFGGTLAGITARLDYIADLGFNALWLNPFFPDETHHGYHATDYFSVNPRLGTLDDVRDLLAAAHARGMRLIIDFVANHWGSGHPSFQKALSDPQSDEVNWYTWQRYPDEYTMFFNVPELPQVNTDYPAARDYLLRAAAYWAEFGFDGFRLDYAVGPSHAFWAAFRAAVRAVNPDAWIFGEVVEDPGAQVSYVGRLDGCLDFLLAQALRATFGFGSMSLAAFDHFLTQHEAFFPANFSRPSFFDNHDLDRFLLIAGGDKRRLKLAALAQMTLGGPPIVYYGSEIGLSQRDFMHIGGGWGMAEARRPMIWETATQDADLHATFKLLIALRHAHPAIWRGRRTTVHLDPAAQTYAYLVRDDSDALLVAFNLSAEQRTLNVGDQTLTLAPLSGTALTPA